MRRRGGGRYYGEIVCGEGGKERRKEGCADEKEDERERMELVDKVWGGECGQWTNNKRKRKKREEQSIYICFVWIYPW